MKTKGNKGGTEASQGKGKDMTEKALALCSKEFGEWAQEVMAQTSDLFESVVRLETGIRFSLMCRLPDLIKKLPVLRGDKGLIEAIVNEVYGAGYNQAREDH